MPLISAAHIQENQTNVSIPCTSKQFLESFKRSANVASTNAPLTELFVVNESVPSNSKRQNESPESEITDSQTKKKPNLQPNPFAIQKVRITLKRAMMTSHDDSSSPKRRRLQEKIKTLKCDIKNRTKKIKTLNQKVRRKSKRITTLKNMIQVLSSKGYIDDDHTDKIKSLIGPQFDILERQLLKAQNQPRPKEYSSKIRQFAMNLNFYSPKAYTYVRETFDSCLPHPRTISSWYKGTDCNPGFTTEAFQALKLASNNAIQNGQRIYVNLVLDEMAIRQHLDWEPSKGLSF